MCNDDVKGVSNSKQVVVRYEQGVKQKWWIKSKNENDGEANSTKRSDDPLKTNMKWSHIWNECNDGRDNDSKLLKEGHSSHSQNTGQSEYKEKKGSQKAHIRTLTNKHTR